MKKFLTLLCTLTILTGCNMTNPEPQTLSTGTDASVTIMPRNEKPAPEVKTSEVQYFNDVKGFLAQPATPGNYPGIVVIHEWWGLNEHIKDSAKKLAAQGYNVLAVDLYNGEVATIPDRARELTGSLDQPIATQNLQAATKYLRDLGSTKMASLGWCFGGKQSLQLSLSGEKLDATVIYYGQLETDPTKLQPITWPVLGVFGDQDTSISVENVKKFEAGLLANQTPTEIHLYPGVGHAFANPSNPNYSVKETEDAWKKTLQFLEKNLK